MTAGQMAAFRGHRCSQLRHPLCSKVAFRRLPRAPPASATWPAPSCLMRVRKDWPWFGASWRSCSGRRPSSRDKTRSPSCVFPAALRGLWTEAWLQKMPGLNQGRNSVPKTQAVGTAFSWSWGVKVLPLHLT